MGSKIKPIIPGLQDEAGGVYQIQHLGSGKKYIGSSVRMKRRLSKHRTDLRAGAHHNDKLQRAWDKYGEDAFVFTVVEFIADETQILAREQYLIDAEATVTRGYNICSVAGSCRGRVLTLEHKAKIAAALTGRKRPAEDHASLLGVPKTAATRAKISAAKKGVPLSPEALAERKTRRRSPEQRAATSASLLATWAARKAA